MLGKYFKSKIKKYNAVVQVCDVGNRLLVRCESIFIRKIIVKVKFQRYKFKLAFVN